MVGHRRFSVQSQSSPGNRHTSHCHHFQFRHGIVHVVSPSLLLNRHLYRHSTDMFLSSLRNVRRPSSVMHTCKRRTIATFACTRQKQFFTNYLLSNLSVTVVSRIETSEFSASCVSCTNNRCCRDVPLHM